MVYTRFETDAYTQINQQKTDIVMTSRIQSLEQHLFRQQLQAQVLLQLATFHLQRVGHQPSLHSVRKSWSREEDQLHSLLELLGDDEHSRLRMDELIISPE